MSARYGAQPLAAWLARCLEGCGLDPAAAGTGAGVLVRTSLRGVDTHGLARAPVYIQKLRSGELKARPDVRYEDVHGVLHCRADSGLGQVVGLEAVDAAVERAGRSGFVIALLHEVGHLAALGMFALRAAERGMIGLVAQSTPPLMAMPGSRGAAIGNNPLAFASPVTGGPPLVLDIAMSAVARGNVLAASREGRDIPLGWAIDGDGNATTDPRAALSGAMLPMAGHKGIGLAMMIECLAGSLTGATPASVTGASPGSAPARVGAFVMVANPELVAGRVAYDAHMADWIAHYRKAAGSEGRYPGERAAALEAERTAAGIPLSPALVAELAKVGDACDVPFDPRPL